MRELEFLPSWYPQTRRRRRIVIIQGWMTLVLICTLGLWMAMAQRNVSTAAATLARLDEELSQSRSDLRELDELLVLERQYAHQQQILAKIGTHVEAARLVSTLEEVMPPGMALLDLSLITEQQQSPHSQTPPNGVRPQAGRVATLAELSAGATQPPPPQRVLKVRMVGVAPTDVEVAAFLTQLTGKSIFRSVAMTRSRERGERGHVMREFEVTFAMDLTDPAG